MSDPRFIEMSVDAWCVMTKAITWSNEAGTDGHIKRRYLPLLHPDGERPQAYAEIADLGLWAPTPDGYQFLNWEKKAHQGGLGQSLASEVKAQKERKRKNQADYRERQKSAGGGDGGPGGGVTGDVTGDVSDHVGQDRTGQEQVLGESPSNDSEQQEEPFNPATGEVLDPPQLSLVDNVYAENPDELDSFVEESLPSFGDAIKKHQEFERRHGA